jgi:hypothetical protein
MDRIRFSQQPCDESTRETLASHRKGLRILYREAFGDAGELAFVEYVTLLPSMTAFSNNICVAWITDRVGGVLAENARAFDEIVARYAR